MGVVHILGRLGIPILSSPDSFLVAFLGAVLTYDYAISVRIALRNEFKADKYAARVTGRKVVIRALEKLAEINRVPRRTGIWFNILTSHPSIEERIKHLEGTKKMKIDASRSPRLPQ